jgi:hypothetical protein
MLNSKVINRSEAVFARTTVCTTVDVHHHSNAPCRPKRKARLRLRLKYPRPFDLQRAREIRVSGRGNIPAKSTRLQHQSSAGT